MELGQGQERKIELKNPDDPAAATILKRKVISCTLESVLTLLPPPEVVGAGQSSPGRRTWRVLPRRGV